MRPGRSLIGRQRELEELTAGLEDAAAGRGELFLVAGEPGIGKSRLAEEVAAVAEARGAGVVWGRCWEAGGAPSYWPWVQVIRALLAEPGGGDLAARLGGRAADLAALAPELGAAADAAALTPDEARFRLFDSVAAALRARAERGPLVILLDDLHAADRASLLLLAFVAREIRRMRVLVVGSYRDVEARNAPEIAETLSRVSRDARVVSLLRLGRPEVAALIEQTAARAASDALVDAIWNATEGNPLFVAEMVRALRVQRGPGEVGDATHLPVPDGIRTAIREHLRRLAGPARHALERAAVIGRDFSVAVLAEAFDLDLAQVRDALGEAVAIDAIQETAPGQYRFAHILVGETLHQDIPPARRGELHAALAAALERLHCAPLAEIAHHYLEAAPLALDKAIEHATRAAERALATGLVDEAAELYGRALAAIALKPPVDPLLRCDLLLARGEALQAAGAVARGKACCVEAAETARGLADIERLARAALAYGATIVVGEVDPTLVRLLEESLAGIPAEDSALRARLLARLAGALQPAADPRGPIEMAIAAMDMARRVGDRHALLAVLHSGGSALADLADPSLRVPRNRELVELATALGDPVRALRGHLRLVLDSLELEDMLGAEAHIGAYERLARGFRQPYYHWQPLLARSMMALMRGQFAESERLSDEARAIGDRADDINLQRAWPMHRLGQLGTATRHDDLIALWPRMRARAQAYGERSASWIAVSGALVFSGVGNVEETRRHLSDLPADLVLRSGMLPLLARACVLADYPRCAELYDVLLPRASCTATSGLTGFTVYGPLTWPLGWLAAHLGRVDDAERHYQDALARLMQMGARPHAARARADYAELLVARAVGDDVARARTLLEEALAEADDMGMPGLAAHARSLLARLAPTSATAAATSATAAAAPALPRGVAMEILREGDYWTVRGAGSELRLKDSRGMQLLAHLIANPGREFHVLDLVGGGDEREVADTGDSGELLDRDAREAYRRRVADLRDELAEAEQWNDAARAGRARAEIEFIGAELSRAVGLGGRDRRAGAAAERARVNVQKRLREAMRRIEEVSPELGRHLAWAVKTGLFCAYTPER